MKKPPLADRLLAKLRKLGLSQRKATELAKGLAPMAQRAKVTGTVTGKLMTRLMTLGLSERKAMELAKGLAPVVRANIKAKLQQQAKTLDDVVDDDVNAVITEVTDAADSDALDAVAPRVDGHRVRLDLPVVPVQGIKGIELLRVMDGLTSHSSYLVAAVKQDQGIVAVRQFGPDHYNVKFYPTMHYWKRTREELQGLGAEWFLRREWYERMHFNRGALTVLLQQLEAESKPTITQLMRRYLALSARTLVKAFDYLHKRTNIAA